MPAIFLASEKNNGVVLEVYFGAQLLQHALCPLPNVSVTLGIERIVVRGKLLVEGLCVLKTSSGNSTQR
ncbi:MAG: hypothetical protein WA322_26535 [Pseudolabrys sp.]